MLAKIFTLALMAAAFVLGCSAVTPDEETEARTALRALFEETPAFYPIALRLTFHDCITVCDGCVDLTNSHNDGLTPIVNQLNQVLNGLDDTSMSRADLWALAGIVAVEMGIEEANQDCVEGDSCYVPPLTTTFRAGRENCARTPNQDLGRSFAEATWGWTRLLEYFSGDETGFGFDADEVTALFGAHTLGRAKPAGSGYDGQFTAGNSLVFNNEYYQRFFDDDVTWETYTTADDLTQWNSDPNIGISLNVDMSLVYEDAFGQCHAAAPSVDTAGSALDVTIDGCEISPVYGTSEAYANNNTLFVNDFSAVFEKMIQNGYDDDDLAVPA